MREWGGTRLGDGAGRKQRPPGQVVRRSISLNAFWKWDPSVEASDCHSIGRNCRVIPSSATLVCRWPHERQIAPTWLTSVSFEISFSRTPSEPATTGPLHLSHE